MVVIFGKGKTMTVMAEAKLELRSVHLQTALMKGNSAEIIAARELLRLSLEEMQGSGYWREHPDQLQIQMRLYRISAKMMFNPPASMSGPDKKVQYIP
jgi:hypothetical protein